AARGCRLGAGRRPPPVGGAGVSRGRDRRARGPVPARATPRALARRGGRRGASSPVSVTAAAAEPRNVRLPAVDDVAETRTTRLRLDAIEQLVLRCRLAREDAIDQRKELVRGPPLERMLAQLPLEVLVVRTDTIPEREDRPQRVRYGLHRIEPGPIPQR